MRILQVIPYLNKRRGGDVSVCCSISKRLAARGHQVVIITSNFEFERNLAKDLEISGVKVEVFNCVASMALFLVTPSMNRWLSENVKGFDLVHVHDFRSYQSIIAHRRVKKARVRYILHPHGSIRRAAGKRKLKFIYDVLWGRRILRDASGIIAVSREEANDISKMGVMEQRISVVYNGIDIERCSDPTLRINFKEKHSIKGRMLLYVGRLHKSKGIDFALRAFAKTTSEFNDAIMVICGSDDGHRAKLEALVNDLELQNRVRFMDFIEDRDKASAYAQAHLFFHTVEYMGGVGLAPLEAVLCSTPVVVTKECSEIVEMADAGYVVEFGDVETLSKTFRAVLLDQKTARVRASRGSDFIRRNFAWDMVMDRIIDEYSRVIAGSDSD